jgi:ribosomal protein S27E
MSELLYPDTRVDVTCQTCGNVFRRPSWGTTIECPECSVETVVYGADEHSPIYSMTGVELVAQRWHGALYIGTRDFNPERTVDDHPQDVDAARDVRKRNQVVSVSENEARIYAERILALLGEETQP